MASSSTSVTPSSHLATKLAHPRAISSHFSSNPNSLNISFPLKNGSFKLRRNATSITLKTLFAHDPKGEFDVLKAAVVTEDTWEKSLQRFITLWPYRWCYCSKMERGKSLLLVPCQRSTI
ncbi:uncharacterized protein LOC108474773 isoform X3 [Gossypium arboreum]|nr:uncharacterized protein LOC108474773 isoform X3 [Gossypium arboreum]